MVGPVSKLRLCWYTVPHGAQSRPALCDPAMDRTLPGFSVHGIFHARRLEEVAISSSMDVFPSQGSNQSLSPVAPVLAGGFCTTEPPGKLLSRPHSLANI